MANRAESKHNTQPRFVPFPSVPSGAWQPFHGHCCTNGNNHKESTAHILCGLTPICYQYPSVTCMDEPHTRFYRPVKHKPSRTHNSACHAKALPTVRCQARGIRFQLEHGVRFFDFRIAQRGRRHVLVHAGFPVRYSGHMYWQEIYTTLSNFLQENPREVLFCSMKNEGTTSDRACFENFDWSGWLTPIAAPSLADCRGRLVLVRRFDGDIGIPWSSFAIQDEYTLAPPQKLKAITDFLEMEYEMLKICFCSASTLRYWPRMVAKAVNHKVYEGLLQKRKGVGILLWDYIDFEGAGVVAMNWAREQRIEAIELQNGVEH